MTQRELKLNFDGLSDVDRAIVGQALRAAADGPFFPDWEFYALIGMSRSEFRSIAGAWPERSAPSDHVILAVNNALNMLLGYPHRKEAVWSQWISVDRKQLRELYERLRGSKDERFFDRIM